MHIHLALIPHIGSVGNSSIIRTIIRSSATLYLESDLESKNGRIQPNQAEKE